MVSPKQIALGIVAGLIALLVGLHLWFASMLNGPVPEFAETGDHPEYYFAYGSNMSPQYLGLIRGVEVQWAAPVTLRGYTVEFGLNGLPPLEPSFANLRPAPGETAIGVVHQLSKEGIDMIAGSEGDEYEWKKVTVLTRDYKQLAAWTLVAIPEQPATELPSRRYLQIMQNAAIHYDFPEEEIARLDPEQGAYIPVLSELMGIFIQTATWLSARG